MKHALSFSGKIRLIAIIVAVLLAASLIPYNMVTAFAAEEPAVTITVKDGNGDPVENVTVSYSVTYDGEESPLTGDGQTNADGVIDLPVNTENIGNYPNANITATATKSGYTDGALIETSVAKGNEKFEVVIKQKITGVEITAANEKYKEEGGEAQEYDAATVEGTAGGDTVLYKLAPATEFTEEMPKISEVRDYTLNVKIQRTGFEDYTQTVNPKISQGEIEVTVEPYGGTDGIAYDGQSHRIVDINLEELYDEDSVLVEYGGNYYNYREDPEAEGLMITNAGEYNFTVIIERNEKYEIYKKEYKAKINAVPVDGLKAWLAKDLIYDPLNAYEVVTDVTKNDESILNDNNYLIQYKLDGVEKYKEYGTEIPKVTDAGTYTVYVKVTKLSDPESKTADINYSETTVTELDPENVTVAKAGRNIVFNEKDNPKNVEISEGQSEFDYSATLDPAGSEEGEKISFSATGNGGVQYSISESGLLKISDDKGIIKPDVVTVKAEIEETANYQAASKESVLVVNDSGDDLVYFKDKTDAEYVLSTENKTVCDRQAEKKYAGDEGELTYFISDGEESDQDDIAEKYGVKIGVDEKKPYEVTVTDIDKLYAALVEASDNKIVLTVNVNKTEGKITAGEKEYAIYGEDSDSYDVTIKLSDINTYEIFEKDGTKALEDPNGNNGWYKTMLDIKPYDPEAKGYKIARIEGDKFSDFSNNFAGKVTLGDVEGNDQGSDVSVKICIQDENGCVSVPTDVKPIVGSKTSDKPLKIDYTAPDNLKIEYSSSIIDKVINDITFGFYNPAVTVKFTATDNVSGMVNTDDPDGANFCWTYAGTEKLEGYEDVKIYSITQNEKEGTVYYTGEIQLPFEEAEQLRGTFSVKATDNAGNETSESVKDTKVIVADSIAPVFTSSVTGTEKTWTNGEGKEHKYYDTTIEADFTITEANFFVDSDGKAEGVTVTLTRNGKPVEFDENLTWTGWTKDDKKQDTYNATCTIIAKDDNSTDGHYVISIEYEDFSKNKMKVDDEETPSGKYVSDVLVMDTTNPVFSVAYSQGNTTVTSDRTGEKTTYYNNNLTATFKITERNFEALNNVKVELSGDGGTNYTEITGLEWTKAGNTDEYTASYTIATDVQHTTDGDFKFRVSYADILGHKIAEGNIDDGAEIKDGTYTSALKVIDTVLPEVKVTYSDNSPKNEMADIKGKMRQYYANQRTAEIVVTEHNFDTSLYEQSVEETDVNGTALGQKHYSESGWIRSGDEYSKTIVYSGDSNYTFDITKLNDLAGNKFRGYSEDFFTVDLTAPEKLGVSYSTSVLDTVLSALSFGFYDARMAVTISASDDISPINAFKYSYTTAAGVSSVNSGLSGQQIGVSDINYSDGLRFAKAVFYIPKSALVNGTQFNGTIDFNATDRAANSSAKLADAKRLVVDNIAPTAKVSYNNPVQTVSGIAYYDGNINATVTINEANFYADDVRVTVTKDGSARTVTPSWKNTSTDVHVGTFTISGDGDYYVSVSYTDKSTNKMTDYKSGQMTIDTVIEEPVITINGEDGDGKAYKDEVVPEIEFSDRNFEDYDVELLRTRCFDKDKDVAAQFIGKNVKTNAQGGSGTFDTFDEIQDNDGIYTLTVTITDKAGHEAESTTVFTVNRYGSVYEYNDYLLDLIADGGAYVKNIESPLVITEYNADKIVEGSLDIEVAKDGRPLDEVVFESNPVANNTVKPGESGWYQYEYTIDKENFDADGVYKISVSSKDATGNMPENTNYDDKLIMFRVDSTPPEINSISGLEESIIDETEVDVKYTIYDTIGLASVDVYVNGEKEDSITDFSDDANNYSGSFTLLESPEAQTVRIVTVDLAGNETDTASETFTSEYAFNDTVTVSTNVFVRWYANTPLFWGSIAGIGGAVALVCILLHIRKTRLIKAGKAE